MNAPHSLSKTTFRHEFDYWLKAGLVALLAVIAALGGDIIESNFNPVVRDIRLGNARIVADGRLCWEYEGNKTRQATGMTYAAQVYESDYPKPTHRELTHLDGTHHGGHTAGVAPGPFSTHMCVGIDHIKRPYSRIGVRVVVEYDLDVWRPHSIRQMEIWRDYYPDTPDNDRRSKNGKAKI